MSNEQQKLTKTKKILPQEWIQDYYNPVIGVLSTPEVNALCHKNNLSMVEMLEPFARLTSDVTIKDPEGINHAIPNLSLTFQDFNSDPCRNIGPRLLNDTIASITEEPLVSRAFPNRSLQLEAPGFTPWFDAWTKLYLQSIPCVEHEFLRHHLGCVFVVSSNAKEDPLEQLNGLVQTQRQCQHHEKSNSTSSATSNSHQYPQYFNANIFKYYVLLHDVYAVEESKAHEIFRQMQNAFGSSSCHLLQFNSRTLQNDGDDANPNVAEHWTSMTFSNRFSTIETRLKAVIGDNVLIPPSTNNVVEKTDKNHTDEKSSEQVMDHPLAMVNHEEKSPPPSPSVIVPKLVPVTKDNIAIYLTYNDVDRIKILIREFVIKCLIPHCERQLRLLNEIVTNRKSRSLFSGAKRWFGQSKPGVATGTSVIYGREAPELQLRKMADLYFMLKLYKHAYNQYHTAKKDFQSDEAWNYYAGAAEMCALAQFMQGDVLGKKYPAHYMEDSITKYLQVCQMPEFAIRASLFDALCLKYQGMFQESALSYVRMTHEAKDLRSALLLEQAAYCYLMCNPPLVRKYAFHIILSGYRFSKTGQKKHSSRAYRQGFQVYKGRGWELAENHILYTLGHQSLLLKDHYTAASLFNELVATTNAGPGTINPLQQMCHLREFFIVHHMREKEDKATATITIPFFKAQDCLLDLNSGSSEAYESLVTQVIGHSWQDLEKIITENIYGGEFLHLSQTCQNIYGPQSSNLLTPEVAVNETIRLLLPVSNPFQTPLLMRKLRLIWKFTKDEKSVFSNEDSASDLVKSQFIDNVKVEQNGPLVLDLQLTPLTSGELNIHGIEYMLKAVFPQSESTDYTIKGKQPLKVQGPRLNSSKEHKVSKTPLYTKDSRLTIKVVENQPKLSVVLNFPETLVQGEITCMDLHLQNDGNAPMSKIYLVHDSPGLLSFDNDGNSGNSNQLFDQPLINPPAKLDALGAEILEESNKKLDILNVPLDAELAPGCAVKRKLWICAQDAKSNYSLYFSYGNLKAKKPLMRLLKRNYKLKILPSVNVKAVQVNACMYDDDKSQGLLVHLTNTSSDQAYVKQVSMLSKSSRILSGIISSNENSPVNQGETNVLGLQTRNSDSDSNSTLEGVHFSTLNCSNSMQKLNVAPYVNFLKNAFDFSTPKEGVQLKSDYVVVLWQTSQHRSGLSLAKITEESVSNSNPDEVDNDTESVEETLALIPALKKSCRVRVLVDETNIKHDFEDNPVCLVPFQVQIDNFLPTDSVFRYKTVENDFNSVGKFLGCTRAAIPMTGQSKETLRFHVAVSNPGLFSYAGLSFQMTERNEECDDDEYIPLEVNFLVEE